jgi:hypothetical protein
MKKAQAFFLLMCFFILAAPVFTQEDENEPDVEADWYGELPSLYSQGDKTFNISMGLTFPTLFLQNGAVEPNHNINVVGGIGSLAYNYFLDSHFFIGFEISGQFSGTKAKNMLYIVPIGVHAGYQFIVWKIEIPLTIAIGIAPQKKLDLGYFGLFVKGGAGAYYRFNPDWSFGIDLSWSWLPQWPKEPGKHADGNFINLMVSARYHF